MFTEVSDVEAMKTFRSSHFLQKIQEVSNMQNNLLCQVGNGSFYCIV